MIYGIDPGTAKSAIVAWTGKRIHFSRIMDNDALLAMIRRSGEALRGSVVAVESIASYGMAVGKEVFETCELCGRIREAAENHGAVVRKVYRREVKIFYCGTMKAKDANVSQALRDKLGQVGTKGEPGPLYGIASHLWSALAVADYAFSNP